MIEPNGLPSRERMRAVLTGHLPDRVPFHPTIYIDHACLACGRRFEEALVDPALGQACMLGAARRYGTDAVRFCLGPPASWYDDSAVVARDGQLVQRSRRTGTIEGRFDVEGGGKFIPSEPAAPVRTVAEANAIPVPAAAEYRQQGCLKDVAPLIRQARGEGLFTIGMCSSQTLNFMVEKMGGAEAALLLFYDDPALALALIAKAVAISIEKGKAFIEAGVDCLYIGDSYASGSVISPEIYRRFCAPAYAETAAEFHRLGVFVYKHCCGNYNPLLGDLAGIGIDAMDGIDPESGMSVARTKAALGDRLTLMGGISCLNLLQGTPEQVGDEARRCVAEGKPGGRYVLGSACAVPRGTPPENLLAAREAVLSHGVYAEPG
jgi:uroporphyrinogen-III decarboxylase